MGGRVSSMCSFMGYMFAVGEREKQVTVFQNLSFALNCYILIFHCT